MCGQNHKLITIPLEDIEKITDEIMPICWKEHQARLWDMIERNFRAKFINKACKWLEEQACCGYIEDVEVEDFIKQFKQAMKGEEL